MYLVLLLLFTIVSSQEIANEIQSHRNWKLLDQGDECGRSSSDIDNLDNSRTIGAHDAEFQQYPWIAALVYTYDSDNSTVRDFYCGGVVISASYVLTAASCKPKESSPNVKVRLGEYEVGPDPDCQDGVCTLPVQDVDVEEYTCHEDFDPTIKLNDICLVRLVRPMTFDSLIFPICLPVYTNFRGIDLNSIEFEIAGWGVSNIALQSRIAVLQALQVKIKPLDECRQVFSGVTENQLCACGGEGGSCRGDAGTPLMTPLSMYGLPRYFLAGIYSYGPTDSNVYSESPTVFTRVSDYMLWILNHIR